MKKKIVILGSTGSIGVKTFNIFKKDKKNFQIVLLSTNSNLKKIINQAKELNVKNIIINNKKVLLSPHSATFTNECKSRMAIETTKNIIDFFENTLDKSMIVKT